MLSSMFAVPITVPPAPLGAPLEHVLAYPDLQNVLLSMFALAIAAALPAIVLRVEWRSVDRIVRPRLQAVWNPEASPRVISPLRRGVGGITSRVPPRPAAGSTLTIRIAPQRERR